MPIIRRQTALRAREITNHSLSPGAFDAGTPSARVHRRIAGRGADAFQGGFGSGGASSCGGGPAWRALARRQGWGSVMDRACCRL